MDVISRREARDAGGVYYFTGTACHRGHLELRRTSNGKCMACDRETHKEAYEANPRHFAERNAASFLKNRVKILSRRQAKRDADRSAARAKWRAQYAANRAAIRTRRAEIYRSNPEKVRAAVAAYLKAHPEIGRTCRINRRARKASSIGRHSTAEIASLALRQKWKCACGCKRSIRKGYHIDHYMPLSRGGSNGIENIQLLTPTCNLVKHAKDPIAWAQSLGRLL